MYFKKLNTYSVHYSTNYTLYVLFNEIYTYNVLFVLKYILYEYICKINN